MNFDEEMIVNIKNANKELANSLLTFNGLLIAISTALLVGSNNTCVKILCCISIFILLTCSIPIIKIAQNYLELNRRLLNLSTKINSEDRLPREEEKKENMEFANKSHRWIKLFNKFSGPGTFVAMFLIFIAVIIYTTH